MFQPIHKFCYRHPVQNMNFLRIFQFRFCFDGLTDPVAVEISAVSHAYRGPALTEVSLSVGSGTATAFVGPDGVGKSTLLGLIAGVRRLQTGSIRTLGADMASRRDR